MKILTGNDLVTGDVVWWTGSDWARHVSEAVDVDNHGEAIGAREEAERRFFSTKQPTGKFISADQVAALMVFLCGPDASDITGAALPVDGAWSAS